MVSALSYLDTCQLFPWLCLQCKDPRYFPWFYLVKSGLESSYSLRRVPKDLRSLVVRTSGGSNWKFESQNGPLEVFHQAGKHLEAYLVDSFELSK